MKQKRNSIDYDPTILLLTNKSLDKINYLLMIRN